MSAYIFKPYKTNERSKHGNSQTTRPNATFEIKVPQPSKLGGRPANQPHL